MLAKIQKWGDEQGIKIPKSLLKNSQIQTKEEINIYAEKGKIVITPIKANKKYNIKDLVSKMPQNYKPKEEDWGHPIGKEIW